MLLAGKGTNSENVTGKKGKCMSFKESLGKDFPCQNMIRVKVN